MQQWDPASHISKASTLRRLKATLPKPSIFRSDVPMRTAHALHHPVSVQTYPWLSSPLLRYYTNISLEHFFLQELFTNIHQTMLWRILPKHSQKYLIPWNLSCKVWVSPHISTSKSLPQPFKLHHLQAATAEQLHTMQKNFKNKKFKKRKRFNTKHQNLKVLSAPKMQLPKVLSFLSKGDACAIAVSSKMVLVMPLMPSVIGLLFAVVGLLVSEIGLLVLLRRHYCNFSPAKTGAFTHPFVSIFSALCPPKRTGHCNRCLGHWHRTTPKNSRNSHCLCLGISRFRRWCRWWWRSANLALTRHFQHLFESADIELFARLLFHLHCNNLLNEKCAREPMVSSALSIAS